MNDSFLTFSGPAYFEQKLQFFQLFKNDLFLPDLSKCEHQKAFKVWYSLDYTVEHHNLGNKSLYRSVFFLLDCMTADETAFLDIISVDKNDEMTSSEA
jgi:hypothetical protein